MCLAGRTCACITGGLEFGNLVIPRYFILCLDLFCHLYLTRVQKPLIHGDISVCLSICLLSLEVIHIILLTSRQRPPWTFHVATRILAGRTNHTIAGTCEEDNRENRKKAQAQAPSQAPSELPDKSQPLMVHACRLSSPLPASLVPVISPVSLTGKRRSAFRVRE